jgi:WD40 repeat protein
MGNHATCLVEGVDDHETTVRRTMTLALKILAIGAGLNLIPQHSSGAEPLREFQQKGNGAVRALVRMPKQDVVIIGTEDGKVRLWDLTSGKVVAELDARSGPVGGVAVARNESWIAAAYRDHVIGIWDTKTRKPQKFLRDNAFDIRTRLLPGPDEDTLIVYGYQPTLSVWRISTGTHLRVLKVHDANVYAAAVSKDGAVVVSGDADGDVIIWDRQLDKPMRRFRSGHDGINSVTFLGDTHLFVTTGDDFSMIVSDSRDGTRKKTIGQATERWAWALKSSSDGKLLAVGRNLGWIDIWDVGSGDRIRRFKAHNSVITGTEFSRDGSWVITACGGWDFMDQRIDGQVKVWKVKSD